MAVVVSVINLKGGVGKSTISMVLAEYMYFRYHKRVLLIDLDSQHNLTQAMVKPDFVDRLRREGRSVYHLLQPALRNRSVDLEKFIARPPLIVSNISRWGTKEGLDMIIALPDLTQIDEEMVTT